MINSKGFGRKWLWPNFMVYPGICLEGLRKATEKVIQDIRSLGKDLNMRRPEYEAGVPLDDDIRSYFLLGPDIFLSLCSFL
jgi:hypothetical protein